MTGVVVASGGGGIDLTADLTSGTTIRIQDPGGPATTATEYARWGNPGKVIDTAGTRNVVKRFDTVRGESSHTGSRHTCEVPGRMRMS